MNDIRHDITIYCGADYAIDFIYEEDNGTVIDVSGWTIEAQLREYPEAVDYLSFVGMTDINGFHLIMGKDDTKKISYTQGYYDAFITTPDQSVREKLIQGRAFIIPETTR